MPLLSEERGYPNEQALIDLVATERVERRRALSLGVSLARLSRFIRVWHT